MKLLLISILLLSRSLVFGQELQRPDVASMTDPELLSITEMELLIADVKSVYQPVMESRGYSFDILLKKDSLLKNAHAEANGNRRTVVVEAGLGRARHMSADHFSLILCHEVGHHLGGAPYMTGDHSIWASDEGQADYFASKECLRKVLKPNNAFIKLPTVISQKCDSQYPAQEESLLCQRAAKAAELFGKRDYLLTHYDHEPEVSYLKPVQLTNALTPKNSFRFGYTDYPDSQCRTDIMFQGALCNKDICTSGLGSRPKCWFTSP